MSQRDSESIDLKTIGLIGGMSWESTVTYYRLINERVRHHLGGLHSAELILYSVDFESIEAMQRSGDWDAAGERLAEAGASLEGAGAELLVLCTNTMHKVADRIERRCSVPLLHIADATAEVIRRASIRQVGLLGTKFTMEQEFYRERLEQAGLEVSVPDQSEREHVHRVIFDELCLGRIREDSRELYRAIIDRLVTNGAEGVILGCTEISLLVRPEDSVVPLFDTTAIHATAAADAALGKT